MARSGQPWVLAGSAPAWRSRLLTAEMAGGRRWAGVLVRVGWGLSDHGVHVVQLA